MRSKFAPARILSTILLASCVAAPVAAQNSVPNSSSGTGSPEKMNAYVSCINRLSERAHDSRNRYFSWVGKNGPTGKERIVYGTYTIYDTSDCRKNVEKANALEPHDAALEAAASAYADAAGKLEPLLKEADDYYTQENYKDDKMAKGKALHPQLVAAWDAFAKADKDLRRNVEAINDKRAQERLGEIEQREGRKAHYYVQALMIQAKRVLRSQDQDKPDLAATQALNDYEATVKGLEDTAAKDSSQKIGSMFTSSAKSYLTSAKQLMRRIRDKVPYTTGNKMMINVQAAAGWSRGHPRVCSAITTNSSKPTIAAPESDRLAAASHHPNRREGRPKAALLQHMA